MKFKTNNPYYHIAYWLILIFTLTLIFGRSWNEVTSAFLFVCLMLPIVLGTSYYFNYYLVPKFYIKKKYFKFGLYTFYTIIISLYLESIVLMFSLVFLANFEMSNISPNAQDTILLSVMMYLLVILGSVLLMAKQIQENKATIAALEAENKNLQRSFLEIISNRKKVKIPYEDIIYIESLNDHIAIHTQNSTIKSNEKISHMAEMLPGTFLRIHRSFIINKEKVTSYTYNEVHLPNEQLNIGRSYKKEAKTALATY